MLQNSEGVVVGGGETLGLSLEGKELWQLVAGGMSQNRPLADLSFVFCIFYIAFIFFVNNLGYGLGFRKEGHKPNKMSPMK